ncbi:MAG: hypothetical protein ACXAD7_07640 [Candidatus Kariarchaeaceae archaeon]|jgi:hypothetical protein
MVNERLFIWQLFVLAVIIYFPVLRKVMSWNKVKIDVAYLKSASFMTLASIILQFSYYRDNLDTTEFQFLQLIFVLIFYATGFNLSIFEWESDSIKIVQFNKPIIKKISKALGGTEPEPVGTGLKFHISTPYRMQYDVEGYIDKDKKEGIFFIFSSVGNLRLIKVILFLGLYLIMDGISKNTENVVFPLFDFNVSSVFAVLASVSFSVLLVSYEMQSGNGFVQDLPLLYKKLLQQSALDVLDSKPKRDHDGVKTKAQAILDKRKSNTIAAKKSELKDRVDSIFGQKTNEGIDPDTIKRIRLTETVKRILNSTPPWTSVSLAEISKLADGPEDDVEIVIAGLSDLNEVLGIYDIWTKTYSGASISQWFVTKMMMNIDKNNVKLDNVKIFPDGGAEFSLKNQEDSEH